VDRPDDAVEARPAERVVMRWKIASGEEGLEIGRQKNVVGDRKSVV
jgi:hypothetical protein